MRPQITLMVLMLAGSLASAQEVRIGVFGLFHPRQLMVSAAAGTAIIVHAGQQSFAVENSSSANGVNIQSVGNGLVVRCGTHSVESPELTVSSRENGPVDFLLSVPGKITRHYRGHLEIEQASGILIPIVSMDIETAVASVVAAESMPGAPMEALKAQAVAARSCTRAVAAAVPAPQLISDSQLPRILITPLNANTAANIPPVGRVASLSRTQLICAVPMTRRASKRAGAWDGMSSKATTLRCESEASR